jgi:hypothetical protein
VKSLKFTKPSTLETFLKILAEEAVKKTRSDFLNEGEDPQQSYFEKSIKRDTKRFGKLDEEDPPEEDADADSSEAEPSDSTSDDTDPELDTVQDSSEDSYSEEELSVLDDVSVGKLVRLVNRIRSGKALKHDVRDSFESYVEEKLDDKERKTLYVFLKSVGDIMLQLKSGQDAQDPSDPPVSLAIDDAEPESRQPEPSTAADIDDEDEDDKGGEYSAPPIKVGGGGQQLSEIRRKVRELMSR